MQLLRTPGGFLLSPPVEEVLRFSHGFVALLVLSCG